MEYDIVVDLGHHIPASVVSFDQNNGLYLYPYYGHVHPGIFLSRTVSCLPVYRGRVEHDSHPRTFYPNLHNPFCSHLVEVNQTTHKNHHVVGRDHAALRMEGCRRCFWKNDRNVGTVREVPLESGGPRCVGLLRVVWEIFRLALVLEEG